MKPALTRTRQASGRIVDGIRGVTPAWVQTWWDDLKDSLWLLSSVCTLLCAGLALALVKLDTGLDADNPVMRSPFLFGGGADGARSVLSSIAASIVTVTGTIFSIVIVALQLASGQFTPRVMRHFTGDRINQAVLAVMIGTFTYCLLVLRTVRTADDRGGVFVPAVSVSVGIVLALVCIGGLILFIHHSAKQLQVSFIIQRAAEDTHRLVNDTFPVKEDGDPVPREFPLPKGEPTVVRARSSGYLQDIDLDHLKGIARDRNLTVHLPHTYGDHVLTGMVLARVWRHGDPIYDQDLQDIHDNMIIGVQRTLLHDVTFGVRQIADIAVKALSPGINDPTTATQGIDTLNDLLVRAGTRGTPDRVITVDGRPAILCEPVTFDLLVHVAFTQIRHYGAADAVVMAHLLDGMRRVAELVPEHKRAILYVHGRLALATALGATELDEVRATLHEVGAWTQSVETPPQSARIDPDALISV
ncbi:MAG: hypothetical protein AVDCRST_MAG43-2065 [uncultured Thermomicrobiales bacterium]|uniref:DUF2254 domain-containing protein n=1 Tax=uncultured Thermomicrobiales bacterium TaxID=1645740 RepID=A0A6J4UZJ7_9BACT|nr:MAG: hypothetical protein AVDCRST_MAG43-2065 [uncultured Thermomicrobiales bacterium]